MTLTPLRLDDLTWADLVDAIRTRIPADSSGRWTLHSPVDPGMTLLDLQAYLLEQQIYRLDQVPDAVVHAVLRLLGVPGPATATAAATVLQVVPQQPGTRLRIREGASFSREPGRGTGFHLDRDLDVLPVTVTGLSVREADGGRDHTVDLAAGRPVPLTDGYGDPARVGIRLSVSGEGFPGGAELSLLLVLEQPAGPWTGNRTPDGWSTAAADGVPPPARLRWSYGPIGYAQPLPGGAVSDGTCGLRRSGLVRVTLPATAAGVERELVLATSAATFAAPPRLLRLSPNSVPAHHAQRVGLKEGADGPVVAQLANWSPVSGPVAVLPGDAAGRLVDVGRFTLWESDDAGSGRAYEWEAVPDLAFSGPLDRVFTVDRAFGALRFGDGLTGRIPRPDGPGSRTVLRAEYRLGGGPSGNGGADPAVRVSARTAAPAALLAFPALAELARARSPRTPGAEDPPGNWVFTGTSTDTEPPDTPCGARAPVPSEGGAETESPSAARRRAATALAVVTRAVSAADHEELALSTPGVAVARAHALVGAHPAHPGRTVPGAVTTLVVPRVPRGPGESAVPLPVPDPGALTAVHHRLAAARLLGAHVFAAPPRYRPVRVRVTLATDTARRDLVDAALHHFLDPLTGGDGTGWPFGGVLRPSALLRAVEQALTAVGDRTPVRSVAVALDDGPYESCGDLPLRTGELPGPVEVFVCTEPPSGAFPREVRT
ncbi:baseplate J/gp47 family protein [Streptomyces yerevanensis]|uniref:baseplate J/gp47 family protein n=1 Tax=Streptomyces yerevanensis TaxID=66378 RepID=UPI00068F6601|nr:baseplate J/gp47 family protein [Streptomyces yerevanensis]